MGVSKILSASIVFFLMFAGVRADDEIEDYLVETSAAPEDDNSLLQIELEELRSKISNLESIIAVRARELKSRDESITHLEGIIQVKSSTISTLQSELHLLQKKGDVDTEELAGKVHSRLGELEKQIEILGNEIDLQNKERQNFESRASEAEEKFEELNLKLEYLQKTNDDQKSRISKTERALQVAEEEVMRSQLEARDKLRELQEVHLAWLPPWLAVYVSHGQELAATYWKEHGQPALDIFLRKHWRNQLRHKNGLNPIWRLQRLNGFLLSENAVSSL